MADGAPPLCVLAGAKRGRMCVGLTAGVGRIDSGIAGPRKSLLCRACERPFLLPRNRFGGQKPA